MRRVTCCGPHKQSHDALGAIEPPRTKGGSDPNILLTFSELQRYPTVFTSLRIIRIPRSMGTPP
jgi:hypothetical protein